MTPYERMTAHTCNYTDDEGRWERLECADGGRKRRGGGMRKKESPTKGGRRMNMRQKAVEGDRHRGKNGGQ